MNSAHIRSRVAVVAVAAALAGGFWLGAQDVNPWTTTHGVGTALADGAAPQITDLHVTKVVDKASPVLFGL